MAKEMTPESLCLMPWSEFPFKRMAPRMKMVMGSNGALLLNNGHDHTR